MKKLILKILIKLKNFIDKILSKKMFRGDIAEKYRNEVVSWLKKNVDINMRKKVEYKVAKHYGKQEGFELAKRKAILVAVSTRGIDPKTKQTIIQKLEQLGLLKDESGGYRCVSPPRNLYSWSIRTGISY